MVMIQLPRTTIRLDERLHSSTPSALLSWVSVTQATCCPREGKASLLLIGFLFVKIVPLLDKAASSKDEAIYLPQNIFEHSPKDIPEQEESYDHSWLGWLPRGGV